MISYGPSLVPEVSAIGGRNYSLCSTLLSEMTILGVLSATRKLPPKKPAGGVSALSGLRLGCDCRAPLPEGVVDGRVSVARLKPCPSGSPGELFGELEGVHGVFVRLLAEFVSG